MNTAKQDNRPKFVSKKDRDDLKKKQEDSEKLIEQMKQREISQHRQQLLENAKARDREEGKKKSRRSRSRSKSRSRSNSNERYRKSDSRANKPAVPVGEDQELQNIKMQYLGSNKEKKRIVKPSEKFKNVFNFEWDNAEDTSVDTNPLYANRQDPTLLFGKGKLAGADAREQKQKGFDYEAAIKKREGGSNEEEKVKEGDMNPEGDKGGKTYRDMEDTTHWSKKTLAQMSERDWRIFREDHEIIVKGGRVPPPVRNWEEAHLPDFLSECIRTMRFKIPTPIQMQAIAIGTERKDLIGIAPTGSGKTAAYLIPLISYLTSLPQMTPENMEEGPYGLIICPTRELATQVFQDFEKFSIGTRLRGTVVVGGRSADDQAFTIRKGVELVVATPGRLQDAIESRFIVLNQCSYVVIDEADKMVEMGFEEVLNFILDSIPKTNMKSNDENLIELQEKKIKDWSAGV
jgi:ATP-dependent RNA helicase DDX23/PRP28